MKPLPGRAYVPQILDPLVAAALVAAPAFMLAAMTGVSDSAMAATVKSSKSTIMVWDERTGQLKPKIITKDLPAGRTIFDRWGNSPGRAGRNPATGEAIHMK
jgi:hypothetical protein